MSDKPTQQEDFFEYSLRTQNALRNVVRDVLAETAQKGLPSGHHFYISFSTTCHGVIISDRLREKHPEEITIVLQNQFEDLDVVDDHFTVRLSFDRKAETLIVPFKAITRFYDPAVSFGLMFDDFDLSEHEDEAILAMFERNGLEHDGLEPDGFDEASATDATPQQKYKNPKTAKNNANTEGEIVNLDAFRKDK